MHTDSARSLARFVSARSVIPLLPRILSAQRSPKCPDGKGGRKGARRRTRTEGEKGVDGRKEGRKVIPLRNDINPGQGGKAVLELSLELRMGRSLSN